MPIVVMASPHHLNVIASVPRQARDEGEANPEITRAALDCFVATLLAMTALKAASPSKCSDNVIASIATQSSLVYTFWIASSLCSSQ
jgi:hypothetical protein